jgi:hypothetical protein
MIRTTHLSIALLLLGLISGPAGAEERWVYLGDVDDPATGARGKLSLNLNTLNRRGNHYEIWERIVFEPATKQPAAGEQAETRERRTLWAIRCRLGELAKVTEGSDGAFEPRAKLLRYSTPLTRSAGAAVIEIACREARRVNAASRPAPPVDAPDDKPAPAQGLEAPPSLFESDDLHENDE